MSLKAKVDRIERVLEAVHFWHGPFDTVAHIVPSEGAGWLCLAVSELLAIVKDRTPDLSILCPGGLLVKFKTARIMGEWEDIPETLREVIREMSAAIHAETGEWGTVTGILRTLLERIRIYGPGADPGVHDLHRGADVRSHGLNEEQAEAVCIQVNAIFPYDPNRPEMKTVIWHKTPNGTAHFHCQVMQ